MPNDPNDFPPHSLRGMTPDQLREYARTHIHLSPRGGIGEIDSIPFAKIATTREMHDSGLYGFPEEDTEYFWAIYKGKEPHPIDDEGHLAIPYLVLGFDLDRGDVRYTVVSPQGTGLGKLVGDSSLPPPPKFRLQQQSPYGWPLASRGGTEAMMSPAADQFLARFVFERFFAARADVFPTEVILAAGGLLISGRPISAKRFFDRMGVRLREAAEDPNWRTSDDSCKNSSHPRVPRCTWVCFRRRIATEFGSGNSTTGTWKT